jgi:hypothetical protein
MNRKPPMPICKAFLVCRQINGEVLTLIGQSNCYVNQPFPQRHSALFLRPPDGWARRVCPRAAASGQEWRRVLAECNAGAVVSAVAARDPRLGPQELHSGLSRPGRLHARADRQRGRTGAGAILGPAAVRGQAVISLSLPVTAIPRSASENWGQQVRWGGRS